MRGWCHTHYGFASSYDPNEYYKSDVKAFKNWSLADLYEPGSTFKPLNVAIALEAGAINPNMFNGCIKVGGWSIRNAEEENHTSPCLRFAILSSRHGANYAKNKASLLQLDGTAGAEANRRYRSAFRHRSAEKSKAVYLC